jgi:sRNA-binding protein
VSREILTLNRKNISAVVIAVTEIPEPPSTVELEVTQITKKIKPEMVTICELVAAYPKTFFIKNKKRKPLMIGIFNPLIETLPHLSKKRLRKALHYYCSNKGYLRAFVKYTHRIGLDGEPVMEISPEDKINAEQKLNINRLNSKIIKRKNKLSCLPESKELHPVNDNAAG